MAKDASFSEEELCEMAIEIVADLRMMNSQSRQSTAYDEEMKYPVGRSRRKSRSARKYRTRGISAALVVPNMKKPVRSRSLDPKRRVSMPAKFRTRTLDVPIYPSSQMRSQSFHVGSNSLNYSNAHFVRSSSDVRATSSIRKFLKSRVHHRMNSSVSAPGSPALSPALSPAGSPMTSPRMSPLLAPVRSESILKPLSKPPIKDQLSKPNFFVAPVPEPMELMFSDTGSSDEMYEPGLSAPDTQQRPLSVMTNGNDEGVPTASRLTFNKKVMTDAGFAFVEGHDDSPTNKALH